MVFSLREKFMIVLIVCAALTSGLWLYTHISRALPHESTFEPVVNNVSLQPTKIAPPLEGVEKNALEGFERRLVIYQNTEQGIEIRLSTSTSAEYGWRIITSSTQRDALFAAEIKRVSATMEPCHTRVWVLPGMVSSYGNTLDEGGLGDYNILGNAKVHLAADQLSLCDAELTLDLGSGLVADHRVVPESIDCHDAQLRWRDSSSAQPVTPSIVQAFHGGRHFIGEGGCLPYSLTAVPVKGSSHVLLQIHVLAFDGGDVGIPLSLLGSQASGSNILHVFSPAEWNIIGSPSGRYLASISSSNPFGEGPEEIRIYDLQKATSTLREPVRIDEDRYVSVPNHNDLTEIGMLDHPIKWISERALRVSTIQRERYSFEEQQQSQKFITIRF